MIESQGLTKRFGGRDGRRRRLVPLRARHRHRVPRPQRRRQDDDAADALRAIRARRRPRDVLGAPLPRPAQPGAARRRAARRRRPARRPARTRGAAVSAQLMGVDEGRVDELLELVGLDRSAARKRVRQYSLGMRQRLGIAHALLGDPDVVILDEPANGLDPEGIRWMRGLLRDFADRGGTALLSSHLLQRGRGGRRSARDHRRRADRRPGQPRRSARRRRDARPRDRRAGARRGAEAAGLSSTRLHDGGFLVDAEPAAVGRAALDAGVALIHLGPSEAAGLEQLFFDLTTTAATSRPPSPTPTRGGRPMSAVTLDAPAPRAGAEPARAWPADARRAAQDDRHAGGLLAASPRSRCSRRARRVLALRGADRRHTFREILSAAVAPATCSCRSSASCSSARSGRSARVITFTLVPQRTRVLAAKVLAGVAVALAALLVGIVAAAITTAIAAPPPAGDRWDMPAGCSCRPRSRSSRA